MRTYGSPIRLTGLPLLLAAAFALSACAGTSGLRKATGGLYSGQFAGQSRPQVPPQYAAFASELEGRIVALERKSQALMQRADSEDMQETSAIQRLQNSKGAVMTHLQLSHAPNNPALTGLLHSMQDELTQLELLHARLERQAQDAQKLSAQFTELASTSYSAAQLPNSLPLASSALRNLRVRALIGAVPLNVLQQELAQRTGRLAPLIARERSQLPQLAQSIARTRLAAAPSQAAGGLASAGRSMPPRINDPRMNYGGDYAMNSGINSGMSSVPNLASPPSLALPDPATAASERARMLNLSRQIGEPAPLIIARPQIESWMRTSVTAPPARAAAPPTRAAAPPTMSAATRAPALSAPQPARAFVVIRFRTAQTRYEAALTRAIAEAQRRCPTGLYTIAALAPRPEQQALADSHAQRVLATLQQLRVPGDRVSVVPARTAAVNNTEVHIYLR